MPVTAGSLHLFKENTTMVDSGEGEKDRYTQKEIITYKCTTPVKRDI